jgi:hypothetical protein
MISLRVSARRNSANKAKQFSFHFLIFRATPFLLKVIENCFALMSRLMRACWKPPAIFSDGGTERGKERIVALAPTRPYADDNKELP